MTISGQHVQRQQGKDDSGETELLDPSARDRSQRRVQQRGPDDKHNIGLPGSAIHEAHRYQPIGPEVGCYGDWED
jgi:hypothetical protein